MNDDKIQPVLGLYQGLQQQIDEHPYETLAIAAGIGFVIGGGLMSKLGAKLVATGLRVGFASAVTPVLNSLLQEVGNAGKLRPRPQGNAQHPS